MPKTLDIAPKQAETKPHRSPNKVIARATIWAALLFLGLNLILWNVDKDKKVSTNVWTGTGSIDLAVDAFAELKQPPTVVLLGSSLMMYPFWTMDRDSYGQIPDIFHHHTSKVLAERMKKAGFENPTVFSFAVFGQMVSDAYIYVNEYLKGDRAPEVLVYGIAPRDFSDSDLPTPMATNTFKRLIRLENFPVYAGLYMPSLTDKVDFLMSRAVYFYDKRWRLQQEVNKGISKGYKLAGLTDPAPQAAPKESQAGFMIYGDKDSRWASSEAEYTRRYHNIGERDLSVQIGFLKRLIEVCNDRGIKLVVVNMPLAEDNKKLMPEGFYSRFRSDIAKTASGENVRFIDLGDARGFGVSDFWDTAHLEHGGGYKLLAQLLPVLQDLHESKAPNR